MDNSPSSTYKGYDIYPLIYRNEAEAPRKWHEPRADRTYSASVVICRQGVEPSAKHGRVFPVLAEQWDSLGVAKRAAVKAGEDIIDGLIPGHTVVGL